MLFPPPPKYVQNILLRLERHGFSAYLVGGCVRDILMGRRPHDWDMCTSATPEEIMKVFPHSRPTGIAHGTVTVVVHGSAVELTTFRSDGKYLDNRHPQTVCFVPDIETDLQRRDFTMNAIACPLSGELCDPFCGSADISAGIIRCVGDPDTRFSEDALRMLRALRFSATLGFEIEGRTLEAIERNAGLASFLAAERIAVELQKTLLSPSPQRVSDIISLGLLCAIPQVKSAPCQLAALSAVPKRPLLRWAGLCALLLQGGVICDSAAFLKSLRLPTAVVQAAAKGCELAPQCSLKSPACFKQLISRYGVDSAYCAAAAAQVLYGGDQLRCLRSVLSSGECCTLDALAIGGNELKTLGFSGKELGTVLRKLLDHVIANPSDNEKIILLRLGENMAKNGS